MELRQIAKTVVHEFFKNEDGTPFELTDGQADIFNAVFFKKHPRVQVVASTQYGKSNTIAMAIILRSQIFSEDFAIVTGQATKSRIIMEKVIQHTFDDKRLYSQLELDKSEPLERIKRERTRDRITWRCGGSIRTYTADSRNRRRVIESLTGLGSPNIIEDEASLIPDDLQSMLLRMLGGYGGGFLLKIGNPFTSGHFKRTWHSDKYQKIFIDYHQGLREGRYTSDFIEEMRKEAFFDILYECKFPTDTMIDKDGYMMLVTTDQLESSYLGSKLHQGVLRLGFDIGEGGDASTGVLRSNTRAELVMKTNTTDLMSTVKDIVDTIKKYNVNGSAVFVDDNGIGAGVVDRLHELGLDVIGIKWSERPRRNNFQNRKAENYWEARSWIMDGNTIVRDDGFQELLDIKYREDSSGKVKIKSKEEMRREGVPSPNVADAFALTFNDTTDQQAPQIWTI